MNIIICTIVEHIENVYFKKCSRKHRDKTMKLLYSDTPRVYSMALRKLISYLGGPITKSEF